MKRISVGMAFFCLAVSTIWNPQPARAAGPVDCRSALEAPVAPTEGSKRCSLWKVVRFCLEPSNPDYCSTCPSPLVGTPCKVKDECLHTEILDQDTDFVAVKDIYKTCGCSKDFVHGLAIAREPVTGVEDPRTATNPRLAGAWAFAWKVALKRIGDGDAVLLLSNPFSHRSQDQLHVHFLRPAPGFRDKLLSLVAGSSDPKELETNVRAVADRVADLGDIWRVAKKVAGRVGFKEYGVAVLRDGEKFLVAAVDGSRREDLSPEKGLGLYQCPERRAIRE